jgi:chemotaxis protein MotA
MIILIGALVVILCVFGGFAWGGGHMGALLHLNELLIIGGGALGALVIMSPRKVLVDLFKSVLDSLKGAPFSRAAYDELRKVLFELFMLGRSNGMIALEEHVLDPMSSSIIKKYPLFCSNSEAVEFLAGSLRPIIDGKIKPDQLRLLLDVEINKLEEEHHAPVSVLTKVADAMPGFGIVAAVLGIVITMA